MVHKARFELAHPQRAPAPEAGVYTVPPLVHLETPIRFEQMIAVLQTAALTGLAMESLVHEVRLELTNL